MIPVPRAVALVSGGLDSILAALLVARQGVRVQALCFVAYFFGADRARAATAAAGLPLDVVDFSDEHWAMVQHPVRGYGKQMNPCIDCHLLMLRHARRYLADGRADFVVTGEVVGQRPMSQNPPTLRYLELQADLDGLLLRPLSARCLPETEVERRGWIDRARLLDISGRGRLRQAELARALGVTDYPQPAGGCLLTQGEFAVRLRDLIAHGETDAASVRLLRTGRHFRLPTGGKVVVSRDDAGNTELTALAPSGSWLLDTHPRPGPLALCRREQEVPLTAALVARYANRARRDHGDGPLPVRVRHDGTETTVGALPPAEAEVSAWRL